MTDITPNAVTAVVTTVNPTVVERAAERELFKAIKTRFDATDIGANATGGLWYGSAPQGTDPPYVVMHEISDTPEYTTTSKIELRRMQFSIYTDEKTPSTVKDLYGDMQDTFDDHKLTIAGYYTIRMWRDSGNLFREPETNYWRQIIDYMVEFHA